MTNNKFIGITLFVIIILQFSCSTSKFSSRTAIKVDSIKTDSINKLLNNEKNKNRILTFEYIKLKQQFLEHLKNDSLVANNVSNNYNVDNTLPSFFNPPPQPSAKYVFSDSQVIKFKTYSEIDHWLTSILNMNGYEGKFSYFLFDNGFVIATEVEQINKDATPKPTNERWSKNSTNSIKKDWSIKDYINILFTSQAGYYRTIVFIISPSIYQFSSNDYGKDLFAKYLSQGAIGLPNQLGKSVLPKNTKITALIYEFKKSENSNEAILITDGVSGLEHLIKSSILKK